MTINNQLRYFFNARKLMCKNEVITRLWHHRSNKTCNLYVFISVWKAITLSINTYIINFVLMFAWFYDTKLFAIFHKQDVHAQLPIQSKVCSIIRFRHEFKTFHSLCPLLNFDKAYKAWQMLEITCIKKLNIYHFSKGN